VHSAHQQTVDQRYSAIGSLPAPAEQWLD